MWVWELKLGPLGEQLVLSNPQKCISLLGGVVISDRYLERQLFTYCTFFVVVVLFKVCEV